MTERGETIRVVCQSLTAAVRRNDIGPTVHACVVTRIQDVLYDTTSLASDCLARALQWLYWRLRHSTITCMSPCASADCRPSLHYPVQRKPAPVCTQWRYGQTRHSSGLR